MSQKHFTELYTDCWVFDAFHGWQLRIIFWRKSYISSGILRLCSSDFNNYSCWILMKSWDCSLRISENETEDPSRWVRPFLSGAFGPKENDEFYSLISSRCLHTRPVHHGSLPVTALSALAFLSQAASPLQSLFTTLSQTTSRTWSGQIHI